MINEFKYTPVYIYEKVDKVNLILESCNKLEVSLASFLYITCNPFTVFSFNQSWTRRVCPIRLLESTLDWITDVDIGLLVRFLYTSLLFIFCLKKKHGANNHEYWIYHIYNLLDLSSLIQTKNSSPLMAVIALTKELQVFFS